VKTPGLLALSDLYYPGWQTLVDGTPQSVFATNLTMRGVYVPAGSHVVEFVYESVPFKIGVYISSATMVLIIVFLILDRKSSHQEKRS